MLQRYTISFDIGKLYYGLKYLPSYCLKRYLELLHLILVYHILDVSPFVSHMVEPDYESEKLTCPLPIPSVPSGIQMTESPDQPDLMCPGSKAAQYICNVGGIDVREDDNTK